MPTNHANVETDGEERFLLLPCEDSDDFELLDVFELCIFDALLPPQDSSGCLASAVGHPPCEDSGSLELLDVSEPFVFEASFPSQESVWGARPPKRSERPMRSDLLNRMTKARVARWVFCHWPSGVRALGRFLAPVPGFCGVLSPRRARQGWWGRSAHFLLNWTAEGYCFLPSAIHLEKIWTLSKS